MDVGRNRIVSRVQAIATGGAATIVVSMGLLTVLRMISSMTLTRLLDAKAYGVVAVVTTIAYVITMLTDAGLYAFIVRHQHGDNEKFLDEVWTVRLLRGAGLSIAMAAAAVPASHLLGKPELSLVLAVWGTTFFIDGCSSLSFATAVRQQKLWRMTLLDLAPAFATLVVATAIAWFWSSYWALIIGMMLAAVVKAYISYAMFPHSGRRFRLNLGRSREIWQFSRFIAASSFLSIVINQSDKLIFAKIMPLHVFGLYSIAVTLSTSVSMIAGKYTQRVLFAKYSKTVRQDRASLGRVFYAARRKVTLLYMTGAATVITFAPAMIEIMYDPRYRGVVPYLQLLAISSVLRMPVNAANQVLLADGRTQSTLYANVFRVIWLASGAGAAIYLGESIYLIAAVGTMEAPAMLFFWGCLQRLKLLNVREELYGAAAVAIGLGGGFVLNALAMPFAR